MKMMICLHARLVILFVQLVHYIQHAKVVMIITFCMWKLVMITVHPECMSMKTTMNAYLVLEIMILRFVEVVLMITFCMKQLVKIAVLMVMMKTLLIIAVLVCVMKDNF